MNSVGNAQRQSDNRVEKWRARGSLSLVVGCDGFWVRHVEGNTPGYPELVDGDVWVPRYDCTRRKINTLAHQVAAHSAFFALQPLANGLDGPAPQHHPPSHTI